MVVYSEGLQILLREKVIPPPCDKPQGFYAEGKIYWNLACKLCSLVITQTSVLLKSFTDIQFLTYSVCEMSRKDKWKKQDNPSIMQQPPPHLLFELLHQSVFLPLQQSHLILGLLLLRGRQLQQGDVSVLLADSSQQRLLPVRWGRTSWHLTTQVNSSIIIYYSLCKIIPPAGGG